MPRGPVAELSPTGGEPDGDGVHAGRPEDVGSLAACPTGVASVAMAATFGGSSTVAARPRGGPAALNFVAAGIPGGEEDALNFVAADTLAPEDDPLTGALAGDGDGDDRAPALACPGNAAADQDGCSAAPETRSCRWGALWGTGRTTGAGVGVEARKLE
jgi:hypothetical protein